MLDFEHLLGLYYGDQDFLELFEACLKHPKGYFLIQGAYLFKRSQLCVLKCGTRDLILREIPEVSLVGHFGRVRLTLWRRSTTIGPICSSTFKTSTEGVPLVKWLKSIP